MSTPGGTPVGPRFGDEPASPTVVEVLARLARGWPTVLVVVLVAAVGAYLLGARAPERYAATSHLTVVDPRTLVGVFGGQVPGAAATASEIKALAEAPSTLRTATENLGVAPSSVHDVRGRVPKGGSDLVTVTVTADEPGLAVDVVNAVADEVVAEHKATVASSLRAIAKDLESRADSRAADVRELDARIAGAAAAGDQVDSVELADLQAARDEAVESERVLRRRRLELDVEAANSVSGVAVTLDSVSPASSTRPQPIHLAILAALVALLLAAGLVYVRLSFALARSRSTRAGEAAAGRIAELRFDIHRREPQPGKRDVV